DASPVPSSVFDGIAELIDQSLAIAEPGREESEAGIARFGTLETVRAYGLEQLTAADEEESTRRRHAPWGRSFAELAESHYFDDDGRLWLDRLDVELDNFRGAFDFVCRHEDVEAAARLVFCLKRFLANEHLSEGMVWSDWILARQDVLSPDV